MHITTTTRTLQTNTKTRDELLSYIGSDSHTISVTGDIASETETLSNDFVALSDDQTLHALDEKSQGWNDTQRRHFNNSLIGFAGKNLGLVKKYFPEATGPVDGVELVFSSHAAINAFTDPDRKSYVKPMIKSSRALVELVDVVKLAVPALQNNPYVEVAGVIVKVGDSVYSLYDDMQKIQQLG
jgi:hypothetical protein